MKKPLSIIIITKDPRTQQEVHDRFDMVTSFPRISLLGVCLRMFLGIK